MRKKKLSVFSILFALICALSFCACEDLSPELPTDPDDDITPEPRTVYIQITGSQSAIYEMTTVSSDSAEVYSYTVYLYIGDSVAFFDDDVSYTSYSGTTFNGTAVKKGNHTFTLTINSNGGTITVTEPSASVKPDPGDADDGDDTGNTGDNGNNGNNSDTGQQTPKNTNVSITYTNSNNWSNVYAYLWNNSTGTPKSQWP